MKLRSALLSAVAATVIALNSGCAYVHVHIPFDRDLNRTELGSKIGKASNYSVLWLTAWGDGSYAAAAKDGNIKVMKHADQEIQQYLLGVFVRRTTIVYGD